MQTDLSEINNWLFVILKLMDIYNELPDTSRSTIQDANFTINESGLINILILKEASPNDILQMELDSEEIAAGMTVSDLKNKICYFGSYS